MTIYVLVCSGKYTATINGTPETADNIELIAAFSDKEKAFELLRTGTPDVKEPEKWGVRSISGYSVELDPEKGPQP